MQPFFQEPRPPHLIFETRSLAKMKTAEEGGAVYYESVDFILITPAGSKDQIERIWPDYVVYLEKLTRDGQFPRKWLDEYKMAFKEFKAGNEIPLNGTPVVNWPVITPNEAKTLIAARLFTVEDVAGAPEAALQQVGMGARSLQNRARDWVNSKNDSGALVSKVDAQRSTIGNLEARLKALEERNKDLEGQAKQARTEGAPNPWIHQPKVQKDDEKDLDNSIGDAIDDFTPALVDED